MKKNHLKSFCARCVTLLVLALMSTNLAWGASKTSTLTFTAACNGSGTADDGVTWTVTSDAAESNYDATKGIHYGTSSKAISYLTLTSAAFSGSYNITKVVVNCSDANKTANVSVTVGGEAFGNSQQETAYNNSAYTFEPTNEQGSSFSGAVVVTMSRTSAKKALYVKSIEVTYDDGQGADPILQSIAISGNPDKTTYEAGEEFDPAGLTVTGTYDTGDPEEITSGIDWTITPNPLTIETTSVSVTATVDGKSDTKSYDVTVNAIEGDRITLAETGVTGGSYTAWISSYTAPSGAVYTGLNAGGNNAIQLRSDVSDTKPASGIISTTSGGFIQKVKVVWNTNTANDRELEVFGSNTAYTAVADLVDDTKKGTSLGKIKKGTSTELTISGEYAYVGVRSASGAMYLDNVTFIWSAPKVLEGIAVKTAPTTVNYAAGEFFNPAGLIITASYDDESTADIAYEGNEDKFSFSPALDAALATTDEKVTITYGGKSCEQTITVKNIELTSIVVSGDLATTEYTEGDDFDFTGLVATGYYSDESNKTITDQVDWSIDPATLTAGQTSVSVIATSGLISGNKSYNITVAAAPQIATFSGTAGSDVVFTTGSSSADGAVWAGSPCAKGIITLTGEVTSGTNYSHYDGSVVRFYTNNNLVLTPANGYKITKIEIVRQTTTSSNGGTINCEGLTADENNTTTNTNIFTGSTKGAVTFTVTAQARFTSILVHYATAAPAAATPTITPSVEAETYFDAITVTLASEDADAIYYTTNGDAPTTASTLYENPIAVSATTTIKAIAVKEGLDNSEVASKTFTFGLTYESLAGLVAAEITSGTTVKVTFEDAKITDFYTNSQGKRYGVYLDTQKGGKNIEIYCTKAEHPNTWAVNGKLSGTLVGAWKEYDGTWEICPSSWDGLEYTAPSKQNPTITTPYKTSLNINDDDEYTVTYDGNGALSITSSDEGVAEAIIEGKDVLISAKAAGTTTITISATETDEYYGTSITYTLTVVGPASLPFAFDGGREDIANANGMSQEGLDSDYSSSPKLKFNSKDDYLIIWFDGQADYVSYDIKGNVSSGSWAGTFDVMESADGKDYISVASYTTLGAKETETNTLKSDTRYVKFVYTNKSSGNVGLGNINIGKAYKATITDAKYATLGLPYAVTIPEDVSAYTATVSGSTVTMTKINKSEGGSNVIPANCGVILYAEAGNYTFTETANVDPIEGNQLVAVTGEDYTCTGDDVDKVYYLGLNNGSAVFKKLNVGGTIAVGKAYLKLTEKLAEGAKLDVTFDETTGIKTIDNGQLTIDNSKAYNLNGVRVNQAYKGIVIMNGKKYINK